MLNKKGYRPPQTRDNQDYLLTSKSKSNPYDPDPRYLKFGNVSGKTKVLLSDGKSCIFVTPGHDIERAVNRYENAIKFRPITESRHDGNKKEPESKPILKDD
jgi:hypothetical protein